MFCKFPMCVLYPIPVAQNVRKSDNPEYSWISYKHGLSKCRKSDNPEYSQISYVQYTDCQNVGKSDNPEHFWISYQHGLLKCMKNWQTGCTGHLDRIICRSIRWTNAGGRHTPVPIWLKLKSEHGGMATPSVRSPDASTYFVDQIEVFYKIFGAKVTVNSWKSFVICSIHLRIVCRLWCKLLDRIRQSTKSSRVSWGQTSRK